MDANSILKLLLKDRKLFASCYNPQEDASFVDFATGARTKRYSISFEEVVILTAKELKDFARRSSADNLTAVSSQSRWLLLPKPKTEISLKTKIVIHGKTHSVKEVKDSSYANWVLAEIEATNGDNLFEKEVVPFVCSDRVKCYLDALAKSILYHFSNSIPPDLEVWPIVGFNLNDSFKRLYTGSVVLQSYTSFVELGRRSGYYSELQPTLLAKDAEQTNYPEVQPFIDEFNMRMGRL